jgi:16S rRNA U516 pseudouridylate synthase RsuA-like enzyme
MSLHFIKLNKVNVPSAFHPSQTLRLFKSVFYEMKRKRNFSNELYNFPRGTMAIGRLDEDSEGLLLLTTDGMMSEIIRSKK